MSDIFISYSSEDRARAKVLAGELERQGWSVWWDRRIPPGKQFSQVIKEAMDEAKCVIVLWSKESVKSEWVQNEASEGARRKILVPALIDDVEIPFEFRRIQAARLVDWEGRSPHLEFDTLLEAVCAIIGQPLLPKASEPTPDALDHSKPTGLETEKAGSKSRMAKVLAAICIVTLITIISIGVFLKDGQRTDQPNETDKMPVDEAIQDRAFRDVVPVKATAEKAWEDVQNLERALGFGKLLDEAKVALANAQTFYDEKAYGQAIHYYEDVIAKCDNIRILEQQRKDIAEQARQAEKRRQEQEAKRIERLARERLAKQQEEERDRQPKAGNVVLRIMSSGQEILKGSYTFDLDTGKQGGSRADDDIFWEHEDDTFRYLNAWNGARFAYKGIIDFDHVSDNDLRMADYGIIQLNGSANAANQLTDGAVVLIRTSRGNLCKLQIVKYGIAYPRDLPDWPKGALLFRWTTYQLVE